MFGFLYTLIGAGVCLGSATKSAVQESISKENAMVHGQLTYRDKNGKLRIISNNHLCGEYFEDTECLFDHFDSTNRSAVDHVIIDYKTHEKLYPSRTFPQKLLILNISRAQKKNDDSFIYLFSCKHESHGDDKDVILKRRINPCFESVNFVDGLSSELYINPLEVDVNTIDFTNPIETVKNNHIYMIKCVEIKCEREKAVFHAYYYMDSRTGLLVKPVPEQILFEQHIKEKNIEFQKNLRYDCWTEEYLKWFTISELYENMLIFNQMQIKRLDIIMSEVEKAKQQYRESDFNYFCKDMLAKYMFSDPEIKRNIAEIDNNPNYLSANSSWNCPKIYMDVIQQLRTPNYFEQMESRIVRVSRRQKI